MLTARKLLILGSATRGKTAPLPDPLYVYCTKMLFPLEFHSTTHTGHSIPYIRRDKEYFANHPKTRRLSCGHAWIACSLCREKDLRVRRAGCPNCSAS